MKSFACDVCNAPLYFENSVCVSCGSNLGFLRTEHRIVPVQKDGSYTDADGHRWRVCANLNLSGCTWLTDTTDHLCFSCHLTRTRPADADVQGLAGFHTAEEAKRRLITELDELGLPIIPRSAEPKTGLAFDLLSSAKEKVTTGHHNGVITLDLAESNDLHREQLRIDMDEPYRTMLGHFRHEIGHYYWALLVQGDRLAHFRELFGDERLDYQEAAATYYRDGPPKAWKRTSISKYAAMHPWEDFAETFAHFLHICDTLHTASAYGLEPVNEVLDLDSFADVVSKVWIPLSIALNQINRSMGKGDLYPFVIAQPVIDKLQFVANLVPRA
ncbi:MAG: putative zinc-binding metallopeptidase [Aeromicrobium sp.]